MELSIVNISGKDTGKKVTLKDEIFKIEPNEHAIYLDVKQYLADNPERRCPDLSKSQKLLGYYCKVNINQGIKNYLNFLKYENKY